MNLRPLGLLVLGIATAGLATAMPRADRFPHREHGAVFPVCTGCHAGISTGDASAYYPAPTDCTRCHDGVTEDRVDWSGPAPRASNLTFRHPEHAEAVVAAGDSARCVTCHQAEGETGRMAVGPPRPGLCITCHAHEAPAHLASTAECRDCHVPLVEATAFDTARIERFPKPASHEEADFLLGHDPDANMADRTCTVCHARPSCERCHMNGDRLPGVSALQGDDRVAILAATRTATYPEPPDHETGSWAWTHAEAATSDETRCTNCHAQAGCRTCHQADGHGVLAQMPVPRPGGPTGVVLGIGQPVHPVGFAGRHGTGATLADDGCTNCHAREETCLACHSGAGQPGFHRPNYRERHAADAYAGDQECASCHSAEGFCLACHSGTGIASRGRTDVAFHTAQPFWLLGHGQAARQGLASCASCHAQRDCGRCHSALGAWRINPHGAGFDGSSQQSRNRLSCLTCHGTEPGGSP